MRALLLGTNVVSILFKPDHALHAKCLGLVSDNQLFISFMTRAELLLWPRQNHCGPKRAEELLKHVELYDALRRRRDLRSLGRRRFRNRLAGRPLTTRHWDLPLITTDYRDFEHLLGLTLVPVM